MLMSLVFTASTVTTLFLLLNKYPNLFSATPTIPYLPIGERRMNLSALLPMSSTQLLMTILMKGHTALK